MIVLAGCTVLSSLRCYPHSLAYFNELAGGPEQGHEHLLGSNLDWGQDLHNLRRWIEEHDELGKLNLAYAGNVDPAAVGIEFTLPPSSPSPGWYAASISLVCGGQTWVNRPDGRKELAEAGRFAWLSRLRPIDRIGYSIWVYHVTEEDAKRVVDDLPDAR